MTPTDVRFIANVLHRTANKIDKMGVEGALKFMAAELRIGVKEFYAGEREHLTEEQVGQGRIRGDKK